MNDYPKFKVSLLLMCAVVLNILNVNENAGLHFICSLLTVQNLEHKLIVVRVNLVSSLMKLKCGSMPNVMVALLNIGGGLCSMPQSLADTHY